MMDKIELLSKTDRCSLYEVKADESLPIRRFLASTPETRHICNDPFVCGVTYTRDLKNSCCSVLSALKSVDAFNIKERETTVLHILRGGLNFGIREALCEAFSWNAHSSAFISAQRARSSVNPDDWYITENMYNKVYLPEIASVVFADVVASGTSLLYALKQLFSLAETQKVSLRSIVFFTLGGKRSEEIIAEVDQMCRSQFSSYSSSSVVYFEGRFEVAGSESKQRIRYTGTDLLRTNSLLTPEFVESQYGNPSYPIERCVIYDAGSRAFWLSEYFHDVADYWEKVMKLARDGMTFSQLVAERFPELANIERFGDVNLEEVCARQIARCKDALE
jgi:uracil phosphoribosyltransferase